MASAPHAHFDSESQRLESFGRAIDAIRQEIEADLGEKDASYIERVGSLSRKLEWLGRGLIHGSFEPVMFGVGVTALWAHKTLELMEIGHMALHGAYDKLSVDRRYHDKFFRWKAPIDEGSWRVGHNVRHHQYTNIAGRDPDLDFGSLRLSARVAYRRVHALQPLTNVLSSLGFATAINLHATGLLDVYLKRAKPDAPSRRNAETVQASQRKFLSKFIRYYGREYILFPVLGGPFFWKILLGNALSEVGRDVWSAAIIYCGHVGAKSYPSDARAHGKARWYVMQAEAARDVGVPLVVSILCGALDRQIEHHLFPRFPPNRLREISPRVRAVCEAHGVQYLSTGWIETLSEVLRELRRLSKREAMSTQ